MLYWRFEVVYALQSGNSSSAINFRLNEPPKNGSCTVSPLHGNTTTVFTISCSKWLDPDGIRDYSIFSNFVNMCTTTQGSYMIISLGFINNASSKLMVGYTSSSNTAVLLPAGVDPNRTVAISVEITDMLGASTEFWLQSVTVTADTDQIDSLVTTITLSNTQALNSNPTIQLLSSGSPNTVGQILSSISQVFNEINNENVDNAISCQ